MTHAERNALLTELIALPDETEWVEFKHNNDNPQEIGEYLSALANSAALVHRSTAYLVWGVEDGTHKVLGTTFQPRRAKKGNEPLENWLMRSLDPPLLFQIHEFTHKGKPLVLFEIPCATLAPIRFVGEAYIRVGEVKKPLKAAPAKEAALWASFASTPFEVGIARADVPVSEVLALLDFSEAFDLLSIPLPSNHAGILARLADEKLIVRKPGGVYDITNLGAVLFAKDLNRFDRLGRKTLRIIRYRGAGRTETEREWRDPPSRQGYALAYEPAVAFINSQLPQNEPIGQAYRKEVRMYPEKAIRELVANALIHQDFSVTGSGPMVEIFANRMEITNPGEPLVDTLRFIDTPPRSRNEGLAALMRRMKICEEGGTGIDKVVGAIEAFQLPAPDFQAITTMQPGFTKVTLFAHRKLSDMDSKDRIRACYQHACLCFVMGKRMTNASLRERFGIEGENAAQASRLIRESVKAGLVRLYDPEARRKNASYLPFWG
jgi:predicted HTH transcriptional regulator